MGRQVGRAGDRVPKLPLIHSLSDLLEDFRYSLQGEAGHILVCHQPLCPLLDLQCMPRHTGVTDITQYRGVCCAKVLHHEVSVNSNGQISQLPFAFVQKVAAAMLAGGSSCCAKQLFAGCLREMKLRLMALS